jgi:phage-related protein
MSQLNVAEQLMHQQLEAIWRICIQAPESSATPIRAFLRWSAEAVKSFRWLHLPRAIAFARIGLQEDVVLELKAADSADFTYVSRIESILSSNRPTRFAEAWTCLMT